jgi:hypothetical protein
VLGAVSVAEAFTTADGHTVWSACRHSSR